MKELFKTRKFWRTLTLMFCASVVVVVLTILSLSFFTRHGQSYVVPDLTGLTLQHLEPLNEKYGFEFVVIDSVFDENSPSGTVLKHDPAPDATVKRGRKFYITMVSSMPDMVKVPNLVDLSLRQATSTLQSAGLFVGTVTYQPGAFQNAVLEQTYRGQEISPGEKVRKGSYINLVVSGSEQEFPENDTTTNLPEEDSEEELI